MSIASGAPAVQFSAMSMPVPAPQEKALRRVLAVARADGWGIMAVAGASVIVAVFQGAFGLAGFALIATLTGAAELLGRRQLLQRRVAGLRWLIGAQATLLALIWFYAWHRWHHFDATALWAQLPAFAQAEVTEKLSAAGLDPVADRLLLLELTNQLTCVTLAFVSLLYQGGLIFWYGLQRARICQALLASL